MPEHNSSLVHPAPIAAGEALGIDLREPWQMNLSDWKKLKEILLLSGDKHGLKRIGGLTFDIAHRRQVENALKVGKPVPLDVLRDYPDLVNERL